MAAAAGRPSCAASPSSSWAEDWPTVGPARRARRSRLPCRLSPHAPPNAAPPARCTFAYHRAASAQSPVPRALAAVARARARAPGA
eukprot:scaffold119636_cov30-Tisochrysis_lutea.AAC.1